MTFESIQEARHELRGRRKQLYKLQDQIQKEIEQIWQEDNDLDFQYNAEWKRLHPESEWKPFETDPATEDRMKS